LTGSTNPDRVSNLMNYEFRIMYRKFFKITPQRNVVTKQLEFRNLKLSDKWEEMIGGSVMGEESELYEEFSNILSKLYQQVNDQIVK